MTPEEFNSATQTLRDKKAAGKISEKDYRFFMDLNILNAILQLWSEQPVKQAPETEIERLRRWVCVLSWGSGALLLGHLITLWRLQ